MVLKIARITASVAAGFVCAACSSGSSGTFVPLGSGEDAAAPKAQAVVDASGATDGRGGATQGGPSSVDAATKIDGTSQLAGPYALLLKFRKIIDLNGGSLGSFNALASVYSTAQVTVDPATQAATLSPSECHMVLAGTGTGGLQGATLQIADIIMTTTHVAPVTLTAGAGASLAWDLSELQAPVGWHWSSPSDTTPTSASDPRVFDQDMDGMPGVTMHVLWNGTDTAMPYVQKQQVMLSGTEAPGGALSGTSVDSDEINIIGNTSALAGAKVTWVDDPNTADNTVRLVPVPSALSCAQLMAQATTLFP